METWLAEHWFSLGIVVVWAVGLWYTQKQQEKDLEKESEERLELKEVLDKHISADFPHTGCRSHFDRLSSINRDIDEIKRSLSNLDERIYNQVVRGINGGKKE